MTLSEFKAWFEGFTESFGNKLPTKAQWARIQERIGEIDDVKTTERVFIDRWARPYWGLWQAPSSSGIGGNIKYTTNSSAGPNLSGQATDPLQGGVNVMTAFQNAGRAEAQSLVA